MKQVMAAAAFLIIALAAPAPADAQILDKLKEKIEKKIQQKVKEKADAAKAAADRKTDEAFDKAEQGIVKTAKNAGKADSADVANGRTGNVTQVPGRCLATPTTQRLLVRRADGSVIEFTGDTASTPVTIVERGVTSIVAGHKLTLFLMSDGTIRQSTDGKPFVDVPDIDNAVDIAAGNEHGAALLAEGSVVTWGEKTGGVPGDGTCPIRPCDVRTMTTATRREMEERYPGCRCPPRTPGQRPPEFDFTKVSDIDDGVAVTAGEWHTFVISRDGTVRSWGTNYSDRRYGVLGTNALYFVLAPKVLPGLSKVVAIGTGAGKSAAVSADGSAHTWGAYQGRWIANDEIEDAPVPVAAPALKGAIMIVPGMVLFADGSVARWSRPDRALPKIPDWPNTAAITTDTGIFSAYALLLKDGRIIKWGGRRRFPKGPVEIGRVDAASAAACDANLRVQHIRAALSSSNIE